MVRSRITYQLIADQRKRRASFQKRKTRLFKMLDELKVLCGVEACAVLYDSEGVQPEVWPSQQEATEVYQKFQAMPPPLQNSNMVDLQSYLSQNTVRLNDNSERLTRKAESKEGEIAFAQALNDGITDSTDLEMVLRILEKKARILAGDGASTSTN